MLSDLSLGVEPIVTCRGLRRMKRERHGGIIEVLRQEHRNIERLLRVLERELGVFDRGDRPDYGVILAVIDYFKDYPDSCHHPKEDIIIEKLKTRDPVRAAA